MSPLFGITGLTNFVDNNFIFGRNSTHVELIDDMKRDLKMITK